MEFSVYFSNFAHLAHIEDALHPIDYHKQPLQIMQLLFGSVNTGEYYNNLVTLEYLGTKVTGELKFSRLYFGQEFCEYLIPTLDEVNKAYYISRQLGWDFTYVAGFSTDTGIEKIRKNLEFLNHENQDIEVTVNDWGLVNIIHSEFPALRPILGRLLVKQMRLARFPSTQPPFNMKGLDASMVDIAQNQKRMLRRLNLSIEAYREELIRLGIKRAEIDIVPQGVEIDPLNWNISFSTYYPWAYVTGSRNCSTAAIDDPRREYVVVDKPCSRACRRFNRTSNVDQFRTNILQRGNTVFAFTYEFAGPYLNREIPVDRLVFEPYIPI